ncbi:MAG TPA: hypothetical protein VGS21_11665, partial [Acidimicrobiales bacterium]|nr:hypothetical protein [Acidimicrobiales bacterium]
DSSGDDCATTSGALCWYQVIPTQASDPSQFDNSFGGSGFMLASLDFVGQGDNRVAAFAWTDLSELDNTTGCAAGACSGIQFGGTLFAGLPYYGEGFLGAQKAGSIPLGDECGPAGYSVSPGKHKKPPRRCPESGIATDGDGTTQAAQAQGQLWGAISTEVSQSFASEASPEIHQGALYSVIGTRSFDAGGGFTLTNQQYASVAHEDIEYATIAAADTPGSTAVMGFTVSGNGGPTGADGGGFFPSSAYGRLTSTSDGLTGMQAYVADMGQAPQDGFTEYQGYPLGTRPRWGDYGAAFFEPGAGIYFASEYIQSPACTGKSFTLTIGTCGGTRDGSANWGTSVNLVQP